MVEKDTQGLPFIIFFTESHAEALDHLLHDETLLYELRQRGSGLALAIVHFDEALARVIRRLHTYGIYTVARLLLPTEDGGFFNLQNYPQAVEQYRAFHIWTQQQQLPVDAIGLDIEPPLIELWNTQQWKMRDIARQLWLAHENVLYPAARAAYTELIAEIRLDGYEVHTYQTPLMVDDRRAGTTLIQRALDVVDLPSDVEVLLFYRSLPLEHLHGTIGGALIASYGPAVDSIGIGMQRELPIPLFKNQSPYLTQQHDYIRDLLLAAEYTDTIYLYSLEACLHNGVFATLAEIDWGATPHIPVQQRVIVESVRSVLFGILLVARFSHMLLAWFGWVLALILFWRQLRCWKEKRRK